MIATTDAAKSQEKSQGLPSHLVPGNPGNSGGKPGRSGRPPNEFRDFLAKLRKDPKARAALERAAKDEASPNFKAAWKIITDYDEDGPAGDPTTLVIHDERSISWGGVVVPL